MKQIMYFLIGISISFFLFLPYAKASCPGQTWEEICAIWTSLGRTWVVIGQAETLDDGIALMGGQSEITSTTAVYYVINGVCYSGWRLQKSYNPYLIVQVSSGFAPPPDSDGDGLPDHEDMYPNDPTPYSVKLLAYWTDDGSKSGNHIFEIWVTDRGDYLTYGEKPEGEPPGFYIGPDSPWIDPAAGSQGVGGPSTPSDSTPPLSQPPVTTNTPDGEAPSGTDPTLKPGNKSEGNETDNEALRGILDNTGDIASNTKRQGEYIRALNAAIQNMDRNTIIQTGLAEKEAIERKNQEMQGKASRDSFDNTDVSTYYNSNQFSGELIEGTDYEPAKDLDQESWFTGFFNSNPLKTAYENSGFTMSGSTCQMTLTISGLGTHELSLCEFDQEFQTAGNLLLALTSLTALIIIAWR